MKNMKSSLSEYTKRSKTCTNEKAFLKTLVEHIHRHCFGKNYFSIFQYIGNSFFVSENNINTLIVLVIGSC